MAFTPRKDFRETDYGKKWNDVVDSKQHQEAVKAAWCHFTATCPTQPELNGAINFLKVFLNLSADETKPQQSTLQPYLERT